MHYLEVHAPPAVPGVQGRQLHPAAINYSLCSTDKSIF